MKHESFSDWLEAAASKNYDDIEKKYPSETMRANMDFTLCEESFKAGARAALQSPVVLALVEALRTAEVHLCLMKINFADKKALEALAAYEQATSKANEEKGGTE